MFQNQFGIQPERGWLVAGELGYYPDSQSRIYARFSKQSSTQQGLIQAAAGYRARLDDYGSQVGLEALWNQVSGSSSDSQLTLGLYANYFLTPRLQLIANYNQYQGGALFGGSRQYQLELDYLLDENRELRLRYGKNPFLQGLLPAQLGVDGSQLWSLELRESFGGPNQASYQQRLLSHLKVQATPSPELGQFPKGNKLQVVLEKKRTSPLNPQGEAEFSNLSAGRYEVDLDPESRALGYFLLEGPTQVELSEGERQSQPLQVGAKALANLILWTAAPEQSRWSAEQLAASSPPFGYIPGPTSRVQILNAEGQVVRTVATDSSGYVELELPPGRYLADLRELPSGYRSLVPAQQNFEVSYGRPQLIHFPLTARAFLKGKLRLLPAPKTAVQLPLRQQESELGTLSGSDFRVEIPAGTLHLQVDLNSLGNQYYWKTPPPDEIVLEPESERDLGLLVLEKYASLEVFLSAAGKALKQIPVEVSPAPSEQAFLYTDDQGKVEFGSLKAGRYQLKVSQEYLPEGLGEQQRSLELAPGERKQCKIHWGI